MNLDNVPAHRQSRLNRAESWAWAIDQCELSRTDRFRRFDLFSKVWKVWKVSKVLNVLNAEPGGKLRLLIGLTKELGMYDEIE